ncbi:hypothetical protein HDE_14469 [Halotydeus destructor]|nr:hypothetical protein HDE_14469 [Halotydeus destructor]
MSECEEPVILEKPQKTFIATNYAKSEDQKHWICKKCRYKYSLKTSHTLLKRHVTTSHPTNQTSLSHLLKKPEPPGPRQLEDIIMSLIIKNYLPFKLVDSPEFNALLTHLQPDVKKMSRRDLMRKLESTLDVFKTSKYKEIKQTSSKISI